MECYVKRIFHFCAKYQDQPGSIHVVDGLVTSEKSPFDPDFYSLIKEKICNAMEPKRPVDKTVLRSLALVAEEQTQAD